LTRPAYTVLLVEDSDATRELFTKIFTRVGYTALVAEGSHQALELSQSHAGPIHLLVTDIHLFSRIDGFELARQLIEQRPDLKIIYISGDITEVELPEDSAQPGRVFLRKPFRISTLLKTIEGLLS
jgi:CheY-like chemotaxis protein